MNDIRIYAIITSSEHNNNIVNPGDAVLFKAKDNNEQEMLMREIALAVSGDVVKLSNGMYIILTSIR